MDEAYLAAAVNTMNHRGIEFEPGLSDQEFTQVEAFLSFVFPPDLRAFLAFALPISKRFPNWRHGTESDLRDRLNFRPTASPSM